MIKNKIKMLLSYKGKTQSELQAVWELSSKQSVNNKFSKNRFTVQDLITLCEYCDCEIEIKDKITGKSIVSFDKSDLEA